MKALRVMVKFDVNTYNSDYNSRNKEYSFLCSLGTAPKKNEIVLVNTRYGYALGRVCSTGIIDCDIEEYSTYAHILSVMPIDILENRDRLVSGRAIAEEEARAHIKAQKAKDDLWSLQADLKIQKAAIQKAETKIKALASLIN